MNLAETFSQLYSVATAQGLDHKSLSAKVGISKRQAKLFFESPMELNYVVFIKIAYGLGRPIENISLEPMTGHDMMRDAESPVVNIHTWRTQQ